MEVVLRELSGRRRDPSSLIETPPPPPERSDRCNELKNQSRPLQNTMFPITLNRTPGSYHDVTCKTVTHRRNRNILVLKGERKYIDKFRL